jgi:hypothetical protein
LGRIAHIGWESDRRMTGLTQLSGQGLQRLGIAGDQRQMAASLGQSESSGSANALGSAGKDNNTVVGSHISL